MAFFVKSFYSLLAAISHSRLDLYIVTILLQMCVNIGEVLQNILIQICTYSTCMIHVHT